MILLLNTNLLRSVHRKDAHNTVDATVDSLVSARAFLSAANNAAGLQSVFELIRDQLHSIHLSVYI